MRSAAISCMCLKEQSKEVLHKSYVINRTRFSLKKKQERSKRLSNKPKNFAEADVTKTK